VWSQDHPLHRCQSASAPCAHAAAADHISFPATVRETRRNFLRRFILGTFAGLILSRRAAAQTAVPRGGRVGWARLIAPSRYWNVHQGQDPQLANFIRNQSSLNIDPVCYPVDPANLDELCSYPFIFTNAITPVVSAKPLANIREYIKRGGFFYIDGCVNTSVTPSFPVFYQRHADFFAKLFPGSELRMLPESDRIFRTYFSVDEITTRYHRRPRDHWGSIAQALYGVYDGEKMISLVSLDHLQCGWPQDPDAAVYCMRQIANIYVFAMTR
jgi:hypothetical protein